MTCQKCGSDAVINGVRLFDRSGEHGLTKTRRRVDEVFAKGTLET